MTCNCSILSPFRWREHPAGCDPRFYVGAKSGKTQSQISSESADAYQARTGRSLGSIAGILYAGDANIEESNHRRARKVAR